MTVAINPGSGPVAEATHEQAEVNIRKFVVDVIDGRAKTVLITDTGHTEDGRWRFVLEHADRTSEIDMPGIPLDRVRYLGPPQDIWDFPRLYENGSSWVWCFAASQARERLLGGQR